jgi:hypothetical protein
MKVRTGFVSNSSSTSFTCELCGRTEAFYDSSSHTEYGFVTCENGHGLCEPEKNELKPCELKDAAERWKKKLMDNEYTDKEALKELSTTELLDQMADFSGYEYQILQEQCPLCSLDDVGESDLVYYLEKLTGCTAEEVFAEVKQNNKRRKVVRLGERISYMLNKLGKSHTEVVVEIQEKFKDYPTFRAFVFS